MPNRHLFLFLGFAACSILLSLSPQSWAGTEGSVSGTLTDSHGIAIPGVQVQLLDEKSHLIKSVRSSETGEFQFFPIDFGNYLISIQENGYAPFKTEAHVSSSGTTEVAIELTQTTGTVPERPTPEGTKEEMVMKVSAKKRLVQTTSSMSSTEIEKKDIRELPRGSEISLPNLLTSTTPGAVAGPFGQVFFRGNHANIQYQIDGVQMPDAVSNTFAQAFSPRNIDHMEVITGGIPAEYGQRLAAVVNIITQSGPEKPGGEVELNYGSYNTTSPHLIYGGSNESGNVRYFLSLNYNRTDRGMDTPQPESVSNQMQGGSDAVHDLSYGNSEFARVDWQADNNNKVSFIFFNSESFFQIPNYPSSFTYNLPYFGIGYQDEFGNADDDGGPTYKWVPSTTNDTQSESNLYGQVVWKHTFSERAFLQLAPYYKYSSIVVTPDPQNDLLINQLRPDADNEAVSFGMNRKVNNLGLKLDYTLRPDDRNVVKTGLQFQASRADGMISFQTDINESPVVNSDPNIGYFESAYIQDSFMITKALTLNAGLRFDATQFLYPNTPIDNSSDYLFQPRIGLSYLATDTTRLHVFYGKLFQPAGLENLRTTYNALTGNSVEVYDIKAEKDDYFEAGVAQQMGQKQVARLNLFYKTGINILDDAQLFRTPIAQPFNLATGYAYGAEISLKGEITPEWSEYLNYAYLVAMGSGISGGSWAAHSHGDSEGYQVLDHAQMHTANAGLTYTKNYFWWTTQSLFGSGLRTGPTNNIGLPAHLTFNTTLGYEFHGNSWWTQFKLAGDIVNIFDNRYPVTIANSFNGSNYAAGRQFFVRLTKSI